MRPEEVQTALTTAVAHHQAGEMAEAAAIYHAIIQAQPDHPDALHLLGVVLNQAGNSGLAETLIRQAIALRPQAADFHANLGNALRELGRHDEAIACYEQALALNPRHPQACTGLGSALLAGGRVEEAEVYLRQAIALNPCSSAAYTSLGTALRWRGRTDEAIACFRQVIELLPDHVEAHYLLGVALQEQGDAGAAIASYRRALELNADLPEVHANLGNALKAQGQTEEAIVCYRQAIALRPSLVEAHFNLGNALREQGQTDEAITCYLQAVALRPDLAEIWLNLGKSLRTAGRNDEAIASFERARACRPSFPEAEVNLGGALLDQHRIDEALACFARALDARPDMPEAHLLSGVALLRKGDYAAGWEEYHWRWACNEFEHMKPVLPRPMWDGTPLDGKTILLWAEQGLGDSMHFVRYAPAVAARGGRVILGCQNELRRLFGTLPGSPSLTSKHGPLPPFDVHAPLMSLPFLLGSTFNTPGSQIPYLHAELDLVEAWVSHLAGVPDLKIGLVWAGNPVHPNDHNRSMDLAALAPLGKVNGIRCYALQKGAAAEQAATPPAGMALTDLAPQLEDFAHTAAVLEHLDLLITVDTSVAHLAGAMGRPVWLLLSYVGDWRWQVDRIDTPWYPTMRLFRQPRPGDWGSVMARTSDALRVLVQQLAGSSLATASLLSSFAALRMSGRRGRGPVRSLS